MGAYSESYWKRREEADQEREMVRQPEPELDVAESAPYASPALDVPGAVRTDDESAAAPPMPAPVAQPDDGMRSERLRAIQRVRELGESSYEPPEGLRDTDIAAASERDRDQVRRSNFTEGLAAAISRRPARMSAMPSESQSLAQRRATADAQAQRKTSREMDANSRIAAALKGGGTKELTPYQAEQLKRGDETRAYRQTEDERKATLHGTERKEDVAARDRAHEDSVRIAESGQEIARSNLGLHGRSVGLQESEVERKKSEGLPYGWSLKAGANPSSEQRQKAFEISNAQKTLDTNTRQLERVLAEAPSIDREKRLRQVVQEIGNQIRVMEGLGVPSGPDTVITSQITGDPTGVMSRLSSDGPRAMAELRRYGTVKVNSIADTLGAQVGNQPGTDKVTVKRRDTGETRTVSVEVAKQLLKNPNFVRAD